MPNTKQDRRGRTWRSVFRKTKKPDTGQAGPGGEQDDRSADLRADLRILGLIIASENVLFALPDKSRIAGFFTQVLNSIPGLKACRVCMGEASAQIGELDRDVCGECEVWRKATAPAEFQCSFEGRPDMRVIVMETYEHFFGFLVMQTDGTVVFESYEPFVHNLANYITLSLENRLQKSLLQETRDSLELRVRERTNELEVVNDQLKKEAEERRLAEEQLKKRVEELEKFRRVTVGRELRVIELKKEIDKLRTELSEKAA